jgi:sec-independent protein translocase protein TatB
MFDLSWSEILLVGIVALLVIGPKELPTAIRFCKKLLRKMKNLTQELSSAFNEIEPIDDLKKEAEKLNKDITYITDLEGNLQPTYDISDIVKKPEGNKVNKSS